MIDRTVQLGVDGYLFAERRRAERGLEAGDPRPLALRLLGGPALLVRGRAGVELFYDQSRMKRAGAMPNAATSTLFGLGGVQGLDGEAHLHRKAQFVALVYDDAQVQRLLPLVEEQVRGLLDAWHQEPGTVHDGAVVAYGRAIMRWAGVPGDDAELDPWARRLARILDGFGHPPVGTAEAWLDRRRCNAWAADLIARTRRGELAPPDGTALAAWAAFRELDGELLDEQTAGIELQNCLRPAIAVARFAAFAAAALVRHPEWRERIGAQAASSGALVGNELAEAFAQEVLNKPRSGVRVRIDDSGS